MRLPLLLILPVLIIGILVDWYICRAVSRRCRWHRRFWLPFSIVTAVLCQVGLVVLILVPKKAGSDSGLLDLMRWLYIYFSIYLPKYLFVIVDLIGKIPCIFRLKRIPGFGIAGITVAFITFALMMWGTFVNRYNIDVEEVTVTDSALPKEFDGLKIVQLSDLHVGSYGTDTAYVSELVDRINSLHPDLILFTGDLVNRRTTELEPFAKVLGRLRVPMGVYSVLGNHDYGDYFNWPTPEDKRLNMNRLLALEDSMGWELLRNRTKIFRRDSDSIALVGVDNIGDPPFPRYGDLNAAYSDVTDPTFKILMTHNPAHWTKDLRDSGSRINLTLSGHTHAMQMSIGRKWSPGALKYPTWGGMYHDDSGQRLYVNIGIGEVAIPARIGATPEVTLFTLKSDE